MINIEDKVNCCGCSSCYNICPKNAIEMLEDEEGFLYPKINQEKCINCGLCSKVCPILNKVQTDNNTKAYVAYNKNETIRQHSTSGGTFTALAQAIIEMNGVVFGAAFDDKFDVKHMYAQNIKELEKFRGSKYVQSEIGNSYKQVKEFLEQDKYVLFSGTPCQIYGLKSFLQKEYNKLYCVDVVCYGVPSPLLFSRYKQDKEKKYKANIEYVCFREKTYGHTSSTMTLKFKNKKKYNKGHESDYMLKLFTKGLCLRPSCYKCKFKSVNKISDITIGDFWKVEELIKDKECENGTNLILTHTYKGNQLINNITDKLYLKEVDLEDAIKHNAGGKKSMIMFSFEKPKERDNFYYDLNKMDLDKLVNKYSKVTIKDKVKAILKPILYHTKILSIVKKLK